MIRLLLVELTRLRWRRAAVVLLAASVVVPVIMAVVVSFDQSPPRSDGLARAEKQAQKQIDLCVARPKRYGIDPSADVQARCEEFNPAEQFLDYNQLDLDREREDGSGPGMVAVIGVLMFLLGTTFVGHDWNTGSMSNQLLFEPRRLRIWAAKALALTLGALVAAAVGATAFWMVLLARYTTGEVPVPDGALLDCLQQGWRGAGVAAAAVLGGYALTMLSRSTVFTLGVLFGVSVAGGLLINAVVDDPGWFDPTINAAAVVKDGTTYYVEVPQSCFANFDGTEELSGRCDSERERSPERGVIYLGGLLVVVSAASVLSFRRRDVS